MRCEDLKYFIARRSLYFEEHFEEIYDKVLVNLYSFMKKKGISFSGLSDITGISEAHLYRILKGGSKISFENFCKIIVALDIEPQEAFPKELQKKQDKTEYGEYFEYVIQDMADTEKEFVMQFVEQYAIHQEEVRFVPSMQNDGNTDR